MTIIMDNPQGTPPSIVAELVLRDDLRFYGRTQQNSIHPVVEKAYDSIPTTEQARFHKECAETDAMSQVLFQYEKLTGEIVATFYVAQQIFEGSIIRTALLRSENSPKTGMPQKPCVSCTYVLLPFFGIEYVE